MTAENKELDRWPHLRRLRSAIFIRSMKKKLSIWGLAFVIGLYASFVLQQLWNWFLVPALRVNEVSFWLMFGIQMFVGQLAHHNSSGAADEIQWQTATIMFDACVPDERRPGLAEKLKKHSDEIWTTLGYDLIAQVLKYSTALAIGWGIHTVLL